MGSVRQGNAKTWKVRIIHSTSSIVAEKALHVAATMINGIMATAMSSMEKSVETLGTSTPALSTSTAAATTTESSTLPTTTEALPPVPPQHAGVFIYGFCLVLIPTATILGNLLVIVSVLRFKALHSAINFLILGLAVADLLVALFVMPYAVYGRHRTFDQIFNENNYVSVYVQGGYWFLGDFLCDVYLASDVACSTASILLLAVISFDRLVIP
jgi:hypothetical protein